MTISQHVAFESLQNKEEEEPEETAPRPSSPSLIDSTCTLWGMQRRTHVPVPKSLGSFPRAVGPAADIRELEYISALHQNATKFMRSDGTISCEYSAFCAVEFF